MATIAYNHSNIEDEFQELQSVYRSSRVSLGKRKGQSIISGFLSFHAGIDGGEDIADSYNIKIVVPKNYPLSLPVVWEISGRIPKDFHHYQDNSLCLLTPLRLRLAFNKRPNMLGFVENCLVPYLYQFSHKQKHGYLPIGEAHHGAPGILEDYLEELNVRKLEQVVNLLRSLAYPDTSSVTDCPCYSGKQFEQCHGPKLTDLASIQSPVEFKKDYLTLYFLME
ncbi:MAG TPA: SEC-C domain-containing protein, partial [Candidatus Hodarchaeales archaeon]|nr:SEC-C domain-containing protein [Candidatus Hodarchaeales archaeon]